jgi:hypothetical protein
MKKIIVLFLFCILLAPQWSNANANPLQEKTPKNCGKVLLAQDGNPSPVVCPDGSPNSNAKAVLKVSNPEVMALTKSASSAQIVQALCGDFANSSIPLLTSAYSYQYALFDWKGKRNSPDQYANNLVANSNFCAVKAPPKPSQNLISYLDSISPNLGNWVTASGNLTVSGTKIKIYKSDYGCMLFVANNLTNAQQVYDYMANYHLYKGYWLLIPARYWVLNDISDSGQCHTYFAAAFGGTGQQN